MRRSHRLLAIGSIAAFAIALPATAVHDQRALAAIAHPAALHTVTISGIDRNGTSVSVEASVYGDNGQIDFSGVSTAKVPTGTYEIAASIWQPSDGDTQTLVARVVHVASNKHVTLDAQGAVAVTSTTTASNIFSRGDQTVEVCVGHGSSAQSLDGFLVDGVGTVYVKPVKASVLETVYQTYWESDDSTQFIDLAGEYTDGIPASPSYTAKLANMAKVNVSINEDETTTPLAVVNLTYDSCGSTNEPVTSVPRYYTDYRTPGNWDTNLNFGTLPNVERDLWKQAIYKAGHTYSDQFGDAVYGPGKAYPEIDGKDVVYSPTNLFNDPVVNTGSNCEGKATVQLKHGSTQIKKQKMTFCGSSNLFTAHPTATGWYTMNATAKRWNPGGSLPPGVLSSKVSMSWRFRYAPVTGHTVNAEATPVTVSVFHPQGLQDNEAPAGTTVVKFSILRGGGLPVSTPKYPLHKISFAYSYNASTWHAATVTKVGSEWEAKVPTGTGDVSLRTIVTDTHGDRTTETIDDAYMEP